MRLHLDHRFSSLANAATFFAGHPHGSGEALELHHITAAESLRDPFQGLLVTLGRGCERFLKILAALRWQESRAVVRVLDEAADQPFRAHLGELIAQLKGEWTVLIEDEVEVEVDIAELGEEIGRLL